MSLSNLPSLLELPRLFAQPPTQEPSWSMVDAIVVVGLILLALTAICKSSQRH